MPKSKLRTFLETRSKKGDFSRTVLVNGILETALQYLDEYEQDYHSLKERLLGYEQSEAKLLLENTELKLQIDQWSHILDNSY